MIQFIYFQQEAIQHPHDHFTLISCAANISEVITKHRKRDIAHKNYQNDLNHSLNNANFSGAANSAHSSNEKSGTERLPKKINFTIFASFQIIPLANILFRSTNHISIAKIGHTRSYYHYLKSAEKFSADSETTFDLHRVNKHYGPPKSSMKRYTDHAGNSLPH